MKTIRKPDTFPSKKVVLLGINARYTHSALALYLLKRYCRDLKYDFVVKEFSINYPAQAVIDEVAAAHPEIIGISVYIWNARYVKIIIPRIKELLPDVRIILGGPEMGYLPEGWLEELPEVDHIVSGAGESAFRRLLETDGQCAEKVVHMPNPPFSKIPFPYSEPDFKAIENKYVYYESSRGCPFGCSYCLSSIGNARVEYRDIDLVKSELDILLGHAPKVLKFVDRSFNAYGPHAREIWEYLIRKDAGIRIHFEIHPQALSEDDFDLLSGAPRGMFQFEIGVQTTSPDVLAAVNRNVNWEKAKINIERLISLENIHIHLDLLAGLPFDTMDSMRVSFNEIYSLKPDYIQLGFLKVLPGTGIHSESDKLGIRYDPMPPYKVISTAWFSAEEINLLEKMSKLINSLYNTGRFRHTLFALENVYPDPFTLYSSIVGYYDEHGYGQGQKDGLLCARRLVEFSVQRLGIHDARIHENIQKDWHSWRPGEALPGKLKLLLSR